MMPQLRIVSFALAALLAPAAGVALAQGVVIQPGLWEITTRVTSMQMPNAPRAMAQSMNARATRIQECVTPEQASRGPGQLMRRNSGCTFRRYSAAGGRISSEMLCRQGPEMMTLMTSGSYTPTSFTTTGRAVSNGRIQMTMTSVTSGRRIGDCHG